MPSTIFRDKNDSLLATIPLTDKSFSVDQDTIQNRIWTVTYNANNSKNADGTPQFDDDGSFQINEADVAAAGGQKTYSFGGYNYVAVLKDSELDVKVSQVGYYKIELQAVEGFGQPTLSQYITSADYRTGDTSTKILSTKIIVVDNQKPVVNWNTN